MTSSQCGAVLPFGQLFFRERAMNPQQLAVEKQKADQGDWVAQYNVAMYYFNQKSQDSTAKYYFEDYLKKSANQAYAPAQRELANHFLSLTRASDEDFVKAAELYHAAALQNDEKSISALKLQGSLYKRLVTLINERDRYYNNAHSVFARAAYILARLHYDEVFNQKDMTKAVQYFEKAIKCDHVEACNLLADAYYFGRGVTKSYEKAFPLFEKACRFYDANAHSYYSFGYMLHFGQGTEKKIDKAIDQYEQANRKGHLNAALQLGHIYRDKAKEARAKNNWQAASYQQRAIDYYQKDGNNKEIQNYIGLVYHEAQEYKKAEEWFRKAADQGLLVAQSNLGNYYSWDNTGLKDTKKAFFWYKKVAEGGYVSAQYALSRQYEKGEGVEKDLMLAFEWCLKAKKGENKEAEKWFDGKENAYAHYVDLYNAINEQRFDEPFSMDQLKTYLSLERALGHEFSDPYCLFDALDRRINEKDGEQYFQSLEFFGDAVLSVSIRQYLVTEELDEDSQDMTVDEMKKIHDEMVKNGGVLLKVANQLGLKKFIVKGESEENHPITDKMLSDHMEALIGAIAKDSDINKASQIVIALWRQYLNAEMQKRKKANVSQAAPANHNRVTPSPKVATVSRVTLERKLSEGSMTFFSSIHQLSPQEISQNLRQYPHRANIFSKGGRRDSILGSEVRLLTKARNSKVIDAAVGRLRALQNGGADWDRKSDKKGAKSARQLLEKATPEVRAKLGM